MLSRVREAGAVARRAAGSRSPAVHDLAGDAPDRIAPSCPDGLKRGVVAGHDAVIASVKGRDGGRLETAPYAARVRRTRAPLCPAAGQSKSPAVRRWWRQPGDRAR